MSKLSLVILCGGKGKRLGNLTSQLPKPLLNVGKNSFLEVLIQYYQKYDFEKIYLLAGYKGKKIEQKFHLKSFNFINCEVIIETNLPTLTRFVGTYDSNLNTNIEFLKKGIVAGKISFKDRAIFSLNIDSEKKMGTLTSLEVEVNKEGVEVNTRKTTTFLIKE